MADLKKETDFNKMSIVLFDDLEEYVYYEDDINKLSYSTRISKELIDYACRYCIPLTETGIRHVRYLPSIMVEMLSWKPNVTLDMFDEYYRIEPHDIPELENPNF
ncbi:MAG: hypothetical protein LBF62_13100 [Tannerellaceae bacterium]|jgi:hypothetical protein|nr:hypothetical protein [Tannerellaceae bacterium]